MNIPKLEVPFNGDLKLMETYGRFRKNIAIVYGRSEDGYPQGRNTTKEQPIRIKTIFKLVDMLKSQGIRFNYLLNGSCHGNREFGKRYKKDFVDFVKRLDDNEVYGVTIGNPFLLDLVRERAQKIKIFGSVLLEVDNLTRLKQLGTQNGLDYICLSKTLLKNFDALEAIAKFKPAGVELIVLANDPCLHNCALTGYHNNTLSHFSAEGGEYPNYCRLHCNADFAKDPRKVISASFVRPEDLGAYQKLGIGIFKLCDRKQTTPWLINTIEAYANGVYNGDLSDIMAPWSNTGGKYPPIEKIQEKDFVKGDMQRIRPNIRFSPSIQNRALDGYLEFWQKIKTGGCANEDCDHCNYCQKIANRAYTPSIERYKVVVSNITKALKVARRI